MYNQIILLFIEFLKLLAPAISQSRAAVGAHEGPLLVLLHPLHEQVWDPQGVEQIPGPLFLLSGVLLAVQEIENVRMPRLQVHRKCPWPLREDTNKCYRGLPVCNAG